MVMLLQHQTLIVRQLGQQDYEPIWRAMHAFTDQRTSDTADEIWLVEHNPVFTQGQAGKTEHLLACGDIPVVQSDRGGQVTYHGPGQVVMYVLIDLRRSKLGVRELVSHIENCVINSLAHFSINAHARADAPGVYIAAQHANAEPNTAHIPEKKICSLGLRIRRGSSFHGLALNVNMDLSPFTRINPCGYVGMQMTQTADLGGPTNVAEVESVLVREFITLLGYHNVEHSSWKSLTHE
ncbi:MAG: lipoyl(octanoyl) transferase LipB [Plesiomonas sp.]